MTRRALASRAALMITALATVAGCGSVTATAPNTSTPGSLAAEDHNAAMPAPGACHLGQRNGQPLPDPHCTPGAVNPNVTQATIGDTICKSGWTRTVRPPTSVTNRMKSQSAQSYGLAAGEKGEYDHLVSLELGGAPDDPRNLWVEPGAVPNPKDAVENKLSEAVCSGLVPLTAAQQAIAADWTTAFDQAGLRVSGGHMCLRDQPSKCSTGKRGDNDGE